MSNAPVFKSARELTEKEQDIVARAIGFNRTDDYSRVLGQRQYAQMMAERHKPTVEKELLRINDLFLIERLKGKS